MRYFVVFGTLCLLFNGCTTTKPFEEIKKSPDAAPAPPYASVSFLDVERQHKRQGIPMGGKTNEWIPWEPKPPSPHRTKGNDHFRF